MKSLIKLFGLLLILSSCSDDLTETNSDILISDATELSVDARNANNWCDGGSTTPSPIQNVTVIPNNTGECCVLVQFTPAYSNAARVRIGTTAYNFNTQFGVPSGAFATAQVQGGSTFFCFEPLGSHVLIELYDANGNIIACDSIENPC